MNAVLVLMAFALAVGLFIVRFLDWLGLGR